MQENSLLKKLLASKILIVVGAVVLIGIVAYIVVAILGNIAPADTTAPVTSSEGRDEALSTKQRAELSAASGDTATALDLFRQAREELIAADQASGEYNAEAPSPEVADIDAQIELLQSASPQPGPVEAPEALGQ